MSFNEKMEKAFNQQINKEMYSSYLYLSMAAYFNSTNLSGFENWMKVQAEEELSHAMKFYEFIGHKSGKIELLTIEAPPNSWESPLDVFEAVLVHEQLVTQMIYDLVRIAREENDFAAENFLQWFVAEQVEEEDSVNSILEKLKMIKDSSEAIWMFDKEMELRVFTAPPTK